MTNKESKSKPDKYNYQLKCDNCKHEDNEKTGNDYSLDMAYLLCPKCYCRHWYLDQTIINPSYLEWIEKELQESYKVTKMVHLRFMNEITEIRLEKDLKAMKFKLGVLLVRGPLEGIVK